MSKTITIRLWISSQASDHDTTAAYYADVARRSELCDEIEVTEDDQRGVLLTGDEEDLSILANQLDGLLRHDRYGEDDRRVRFTWEVQE